MMKLLYSLKRRCRELRERFRTPAVRDQILYRSVRRFSWNRALLVILILAVVTMGTVFLFFNLVTSTMKRNVNQSLEQAVEQQKIHFDFRLRSVQQQAENLMNVIYPCVSSNAEPAEQYKEYAELRSAFGLCTGNEDISNIRLYVPSGKIYSKQGGTFRSLTDLSGSETYLPYLDHVGISWMETQVVPILDQSGNRSDMQALTCVFSMRQKTDYSRIACVLMLDVNVANFDKLLTAEGSPNQRAYLVSGSGVCLASPSKKELGKQIISDDLTAQMKAMESGSIEQGRSVYVFRKLGNFDWYVLVDYPSSMLSVADSLQANFLKCMVAIMLIVSLTIVFILAYHFITNLTLTRINATLEALNTGKPPAAEEAPEFLDPLHHLERNADQMVLTIKELMEDRYKDQLAIADSQMKSLQAQIKPHFLYNTLDIIKWMILDDQTEDAVWMVNALSKYLRQSINKGPAIIPLREELELSRNYLQIMQKRFKNRFTVGFEVEDEALDCRIPKLSLQPLLENALLHGVLYSEKPEKELTIRAWVAEGMLCIEVEDSGEGMSEEQCRKLENGESGYGFTNVRKRLELYGKGKSRCSIFSREGVGTCISIQIPAANEGDTFETQF